MISGDGTDAGQIAYTYTCLAFGLPHTQPIWTVKCKHFIYIYMWINWNILCKTFRTSLLKVTSGYCIRDFIPNWHIRPGFRFWNCIFSTGKVLAMFCLAFNRPLKCSEQRERETMWAVGISGHILFIYCLLAPTLSFTYGYLYYYTFKFISNEIWTL